MAALPFGTFTLADGHGRPQGAVVIAQGSILFQRAAGTPVHDLSYLVIWSATRTEAIRRELQALEMAGARGVGPATPGIHAILHAIAPSATAALVHAGACRRFFARRVLKAALRTAHPHPLPQAV
jgi:hypothetical protein